MRLEYITKSIETISGQEMCIVDMDKIDDITEKTNIEGRKYVAGALMFYRESTKKNIDNNFSIAIGTYTLHDFNKVSKVYLLGDKWYQVAIEWHVCKSCDWKGDIANPIGDIDFFYYPKFENWTDYYDEAKDLPEVGCPKCGSKLDRKAIWAGQYY